MSEALKSEAQGTSVKAVSLEEILKPARRTRVIDIGANPIDGDPPYKVMLESGLCDVTGFEPQEAALANLNTRKGPHELYLPYAVGDGARHTLNICHASGMTSLFKPNPDTLAMFNLFPSLGLVVGNVDIDTRRLDDIDEVQSFDFLKIDIQGSELSVFRNGRQKLRSAVAIQTEVSFVTLYRDQPCFGDVDLELRSQGFIPHCFAGVRRKGLAPIVIDGNPRVALNQVVEADIVYVRDFSKPDLLSTEQLQHLALIAHYCYGSYDLAAFCVHALTLRGEGKEMDVRYLASLIASEKLQKVEIDTVGVLVSKDNVYLGHLLIEARERHRKGEFAEAEKLYRDFVEISPNNSEVLTLWGTLNAQKGDFEEAIRLINRSLEIDQRQPVALNSLGNALNSLVRYEEALTAFDRALALKASYASALNNRGTSLRGLRRPKEALASIDKAIVSNLEYAEGFNNRGLALQDLGRRDDALKSYDRALSLKPEFPDALKNRGNVLRELGRLDEALSSYDKAIALKADAHIYHCRSFAHMELKHFDKSFADIEKAVALNPRLPYVQGQLLTVKTQQCSWQGLQDVRKNVVATIQQGSLACTPDSLLTVACAPDIRRRCAELHVADKYPPQLLPSSQSKRRVEAPSRDGIRLAYLSGNFHSSAVVSLVAGIAGHHDRTRFEVHGISFGAQEKIGSGDQLKGAFDHFTDVTKKSDIEVAELLRDRQIDIAVDLMGFAAGCRTGIFSFRPSPVQVSFLGFPGTMGADYIDYVIADQTVVPAGEQDHYIEKVAYLPGTYLCHGIKRSVASTPRRTDVGLPEKGFVFCSFNAGSRITPEVFDTWMRILLCKEGSVLWLLESNVAAKQNLQREAEKRGVSRERLVFSPVVAYPAHLARYRMADLFLDTFPQGARMTASDALWSGLPLLTCAGDNFAGRVATSLLSAIGLPELITNSVAEYEEKAVALAMDPPALREVRTKLEASRSSPSLFDSVRFTRNLEAAYARMVELHRSGGQPVSFTIDSAEEGAR